MKNNSIFATQRAGMAWDRLVLCGLVLLLLAFTTACSSSKSRVGGALNLDTDLTLAFQVSADINPNDSNRPSPLFVRLYQLKSPNAFESADFIDLYERGETVLGTDMIAKQMLKAFTPGESRQERFVLEPGVRFIAVFAEFSQYPGSTYKVVFPVTENNVIRNKETIKISDRKIALLKK